MRLKNAADTWIGKIRGNDRLETLENLSILLIVVGALMLSAGIGLNISAREAATSAVLAMMGSLVAFVFTVLLVVTWVAREFSS